MGNRMPVVLHGGTPSEVVECRGVEPGGGRINSAPSSSHLRQATGPADRIVTGGAHDLWASHGGAIVEYNRSGAAWVPQWESAKAVPDLRGFDIVSSHLFLFVGRDIIQRQHLATGAPSGEWALPVELPPLLGGCVENNGTSVVALVGDRLSVPRLVRLQLPGGSDNKQSQSGHR